ncbi:polysaccharide biosynthesis C-terminal domain-containing protein [Arthrobacter sp. MSA 4-2]|uniref:oligosaccharide flippase family protein n=1 Tax=Arthrobacter sp. MSA 4-2 TaxID=2794349 RepID=UPI0018E7B669|nr:polysaccharide biosynthesis C-terminal domain-containing protein [Arthrobacter sp. MSA 4-2]MBJ2119700.1 polysaccharide biosynthesis C-terminal domain-containing protein [Arthrobacter sp. MSA 4-2]
MKAEHASEARRAARGGLISGLGAGTSAVMGLLLILVLGRSFGEYGAGIVLQSIAVFSIALGIARTGMDTTSVWILPRLASSAPERIRGAVLALLLPAFAVSIALTLMLYFLLPPLTENLVHLPPEVVGAVRTIALFLPFAAVMMVALAATRGLGSILPYTVIGAVAVPAARPLAVLTVVLLGGSAAMGALAWALPLPAAMALALLVLAGRVREHERRAGVSGRWRPSPKVSTGVRRFALPRWYSSGVEQAIVWFDVILVGAIAGAGAAGIYGTVSRFVTAGLIVSTAMRMVISPRFSALLEERKVDAVQTLYSTTLTWIVLFGTPIYGLFMFFAPTVLSWFGPGFSEGATALIILCVGAICFLFGGNIDSVLTMSGRSGWMAFNKSVVLAVNIAANLVLVPRWGILGAASAWAFSMFLDALLASIETRIFVGIRFDAVRVAYALMVAAVSVVPGSLLVLSLLGSSTTSLAVAGLITVTILALWCWFDRYRLRLDGLRPAARKPAAAGSRTAETKGV